MTNSIRPGRAVSLPEQGEAQNEPVALRGCVRKRRQGRSGGWRRNVRKARHVKQFESLNQAWDVDDRIEVQNQMHVISCQTHRENFRAVPPRHRREKPVEKSGCGSL